VQARLDVLAQLVVRRRRAVENGDRRDVQPRARLLEVQEGRVEGGDALAGGDRMIVPRSADAAAVVMLER
jgi:hypothetical protein